MPTWDGTNKGEAYQCMHGREFQEPCPAEKFIAELEHELAQTRADVARHADSEEVNANRSRANDLEAEGQRARAEKAERERDEARERLVWECGCGHVNDCSLATCAACGRRPGAKE